jgi:hypothetical protein
MTEQEYIQLLETELKKKYAMVKTVEYQWRYTVHFGQSEFVSFANLQKSTIKPLISEGIMPLTIKNLLK